MIVSEAVEQMPAVQQQQHCPHHCQLRKNSHDAQVRVLHLGLDIKDKDPVDVMCFEVLQDYSADPASH
jgi:hypothetical protein